MYIKVVVKNNKTYYILCICDALTKYWSSCFIGKKVAYILMENGVKVIEK